MNKEELNKLKATIYSQIEQLNDATALLMVQEAVTEYSSSTNDILDQLTPEQQQRLQQSIKQADEGKTFSNEDVDYIIEYPET